MWYIISAVIVVWFIYKYRKKKQTALEPSITVSMHVNNSGWEEAKKQKEDALKRLKKSFVKPHNVEESINSADAAIKEFINNHDLGADEIVNSYNEIKLPGDLKKRELTLRKEINKHYKNREKKRCKVLTIYIALQHAKLQLNSSGIDLLSANLKKPPSKSTSSQRNERISPRRAPVKINKRKAATAKK